MGTKPCCGSTGTLFFHLIDTNSTICCSDESDISNEGSWSTENADNTLHLRNGSVVDLTDSGSITESDMDVPYVHPTFLDSVDQESFLEDLVDDDLESEGSLDGFIVDDVEPPDREFPPSDDGMETATTLSANLTFQSSDEDSTISNGVQRESRRNDSPSTVTATQSGSDSEPLAVHSFRARPRGSNRNNVTQVGRSGPRNMRTNVSNTSQGQHHVIISSDSDSDSPIGPQRLRTRARIRRQSPQNDHEGTQILRISSEDTDTERDHHW